MEIKPLAHFLNHTSTLKWLVRRGKGEEQEEEEDGESARKRSELS